MSTRCQIGFYQEDNKGDVTVKPEALIYKHSDGYPDDQSGVMAWLVPYYETFMAERGVDPEYMAAWCIHTICSEQVKWAKNYERRHKRKYPNEPFKPYPRFTGVGACYDHFRHVDIEYYYSVTPEKIYVTKVSCRNWEEPEVISQKVVMTHKKGAKFAVK